MNKEMSEQFLEFSISRLEVLSHHIDDCLGRLTDEQIWWRAGERQNAIGNLVVHLCGNVRQWVISGIGKAPDTRNRNAEFEARGTANIEQLRRELKETISRALKILRELPAERLSDMVRAATNERSVLQAIYSVVEHFAQHTGQIMFATKQMTGQDLGYYAHLNRAKVSK